MNLEMFIYCFELIIFSKIKNLTFKFIYLIKNFQIKLKENNYEKTFFAFYFNLFDETK